MFKLQKIKRSIKVAVVATLGFFSLPTLVAHAQVGAITTAILAYNTVLAAKKYAGELFTIGDIGFAVVSKLAFYISTIAAGLMGIFIAIESWFLQIILKLNFNLVNSTPVKLGFPIVLSIANLAFVAGLIVVAIATIVNQERYGLKKVLWRLVVIAVVVNFGLVICGSVLAVSDNMTMYFLNSINPNGSNNTFANFTNALAGAFNPQDGILNRASVLHDPADAAEKMSGAVGDGVQAGQTIGKFLLPFTSILATLGALTIIIVTLAILISTLLVRYVKVGILLITLPLAWAAYVFPDFESHFKKWVGDFNKNLVFPPIMVFFLWLSLKISEVMSNKAAEYNFTIQENDGGPGSSIANLLSNTLSPTIEQLLRIFIVWGIMMGGLVAAQSLGVKAAETGINAITAAGKAGRNYAGKKLRPSGNITRTIRKTVQKYQPGKLAMSTSGVGRILNPFRRTINAVSNTTYRATVGTLRTAEGIQKLVAPPQAEKKTKSKDLKRKDGESDTQWEARVGGINKDLKRFEESIDQWQERVAAAAKADPHVMRQASESIDDWRTRVAARNPSLAPKPPESHEDWVRRVEGFEEGLSSSEWETDSLLGSVLSAMKKSSGHKQLSAKEVEKALGIHFKHEEGDGGHGGGHGGGGGGGGSGGHGGGGGGQGGGHGGHP